MKGDVNENFKIYNTLIWGYKQLGWMIVRKLSVHMLTSNQSYLYLKSKNMHCFKNKINYHSDKTV